MTRKKNFANVVLKGLKAADKNLLDKLRTETNEKTNTKAVWAAIRRVFDNKKQIESLSARNAQLEDQLENAKIEKEQLKGMITAYFEFKDETEKMNERHLKEIRTMAKKVDVKQNRRTRG